MRKLTQWHPGFGVALEKNEALPEWLAKAPYTEQQEDISLDASQLNDRGKARLVWIRDLLMATQNRAPNHACHGLHEWAMVYKGSDIRHRETLPLRLSQSEVDEVVSSRPIRCSHFDAFRFFHKEAQPLNQLQPDMDSRMQLEQPGCLHAGMDLYKWTSKAMPWVSSELQLDCFEMAVQFRELDMRASPYDVSSFGLSAVKIETPEGRRLYEKEQKKLTEAAAKLRARLIDELQTLPFCH